MIIKPSMRSNFFTNAHPLGSEQFVLEQIKEAKASPPFKGPKNVLIIGGSSGYGLASRIALAFGANANTINVSYESGPKGKRTGSAGYWNNLYFQKHANETNTTHIDFLGDAFGKETKAIITKTIKETFGHVDLVIYSLAAGGRRNEETGDIVQSHIKTMGEPIHGKTIDIKSEKLIDITIDNATDQEIKDTVFVMGGSDWQDWINYLDKAEVLSEQAKTIAYTYIGGPTTQSVYRHGTLGQAKTDLEQKAKTLNTLLANTYKGEALISSSKAVVSKASIFIPQMPIYVSCLYDVMLKADKHESILEHKYRLFKDMVYGEDRLTDEENRIRVDHIEMEPSIQKATNDLMHSLDDNTLFDLKGTKHFLQQFYKISGFGYSNIDYEKDIDLDTLNTSLRDNAQIIE